MIATLTLTCLICKQSPPCDCWAKCVKCGRSYPAKNGACDQPIHQFDAEAEQAFQNGYWRIDEHNNRLYKTRASSLRAIYEAMAKGNLWLSRKQFNDDVLAGMKGK